MEEKINNQKIFSYVPSLIARLILNSNLKDKDIFSDNTNAKNEQLKNTLLKNQAKIKSTFLTSLSINPSIYPINHYLPHTIVMNIRLKGFQKLISTLSIKDPKDQIEKMISEYLSIITPKHLLKISKIISKNGGEIIKYNDYEFTTIWNFTPKKNRIQRYQKFYAKQALLSAYQIMKELDNQEIVNNIKMKISIGIALGETTIGFFGGERKRGEYIVMGEAIQKAEMCINYCYSHETIISEEINNLFVESEDVTTKEIDSKENLHLFSIEKYNENILNNFKGFKIKMKYDKLNMTKAVYENLAKKVYIFSSILPQGLVKYLDVDQDQNLKEISIVTIATIHIFINKEIINNLKAIQNIILDIQKATYLTFGSLLYISKTYNGLLVRCVWGMDPGSFLDDTARCISTAILIGSLTDYYNIKIGIGISTGSCYTGLIPIQGDRKQFTLMGKKVNMSRTLADEAFQKIINSHGRKKYLIYCDKKTMKQSQKWFKHLYISKINIYFNKESQELYYETKEDSDNGFINENDLDPEHHNDNVIYKKLARNNSMLFGEYNRKSIKNFIRHNSRNNTLKSNVDIITFEIYSPMENEEYFVQNINDPFPLLRTHRHNSYTPKIKHYFYNHFQNTSLSNQINLGLIGKLPMPNMANEEEQKKMNIKLEKSKTIFGYDEEIKRCVNILNLVKQKNKKQFILVKGPLGVGKSLFIRNVLDKYLESNEELKKIYFNKDDFIFFNRVDPLTATFPYNTFCFILRKIYFYIKKIKKLKELNQLCEELNLNKENIKNINFILSMGRKDINVRDGFEKKEFSQRNTITSFTQKNFIKGKIENISYISELEGPFKIKDSNKIDNFFFEMIKMYKSYLNKKYNSKKIKFRSSLIKTKNKIPLILVVDDVQMSDKYSIDFIRYLFNNDEKKNNPFIIILVEQTPFNKNYRPILHRELEFFLSAFGDSDDEDEDEKIGNDKIITFKINPIMDKDILKKIIIINFNNYVIKNYFDSKLESIDSKILDFLLMKTFQGVPLLVIELFLSLLKSQKFIKLIDNEFRITQELIDDNDVFDWSNILLPYIYEKITSMTINSLLIFKEILLLKYACTIGTIFDIQTLDKINPLNLIIKKEDLYNIVEKLSNEYIIEVFENDRMNRRTKKCLICKICFPFMREVLYKKFPIERRASLHAETAKLLSGEKKAYYFNSHIEGKILNRHLIYSEINVVDEVESRTDHENLNSYKNTRIMNTNNLTVLFVKDICSRIFDRKNRNIMEGYLEMLIGNKWINMNYYVDRQYKIYFQNTKTKITKNDKDLEFIIPIKDIFKNVILENNILEITVAELSFYLQNKYKKKLTFHSYNYQDIFHLNTALPFLKMIATYEKYIYNFGYTKFPLYKTDWYAKKEKKYYANIYPNQLLYYNNSVKPSKKKRFSCLGLVNQTDKLINQSKDINKPFTIIMRTTFTILMAYIQKNITKYKDNINNDEIDPRFLQGNKGYLIYIPTPLHVKSQIKRVLYAFEKKERKEEELLRLRHKGKFSIFPLSLLKQERRMFGSGVFDGRRNQSISHCKFSKFIEEKKIIKEGKQNKVKAKCNFTGRKTGKSKTILDTNDIIRELGDKIKVETSIEFIDYEDSESNKESESELSSSKIFKSENTKTSIYFSESESESKNSSVVSDSSKDEKKNKLDNNINNIKIITPDKTKDKNKNNYNKQNSIIHEIIDYKDNSHDDNESLYEDRIDINKNEENNNNSVDSSKHNIDNKNKNIKLSKFYKNNKKNVTPQNNYSINNYINNNININLINNIDSALNNSFLNKKILKNNLNIDINALRMSYQKQENIFLLKFKRPNQKKSNSAKVKTLKEKYRNSLNYYLNSNSTNKMSLDDDEEESITSDKESENTDSNLILIPKVLTKKKNSKGSEHTPKKGDIFSKVMISFLTDENTTDLIKSLKNNNTTSKHKLGKKISNSNLNFKGLNNIDINKDKFKKKKRSSLCTGINFQIKNRNRHVTFTQKLKDQSESQEKNYKYRDIPTSKFFKNLSLNKNDNNMKRIRFNNDK